MDKVREAFARGIYQLQWHQLTANQQFIVDAAVKTHGATMPKVTEGELVHTIESVALEMANSNAGPKLFPSNIARAILQKFPFLTADRIARGGE